MKPLIVVLLLSSAGEAGAPNVVEKQFTGPNAPRECAAEVSRYMEVVSRSEERGLPPVNRRIKAECSLTR